MKKLSLSTLAFQKGEVLTRSQLKKVLGGNGSEDPGPGSVIPTCLVYCRDASGNQVGEDKEVSSCDAPLNVTMDTACSGVPGYVLARTTCSC